MEIHNVTEDIVLDAVNEIFDLIERENRENRPCTCFQCRLDTACYALNRLSPHYVVSSRGVARAEEDTIAHQQEGADVVSLVHEGMAKIAKSKRPHFEHRSGKETPQRIEGPVFNFPTIIGRVFDGQNFSPLNDVDVTLCSDAKPVGMIDPNWQNPYRLVSATSGAFSFWPRPVSAEAEGTARSFGFAISAIVPGCEDLKHFFEIPLVSERAATTSFSMNRTFKLPDLYVFPVGIEQDD